MSKVLLKLRYIELLNFIITISAVIHFDLNDKSSTNTNNVVKTLQPTTTSNSMKLLYYMI